MSRCMMPYLSKALIPYNKSLKILSASSSGITLNDMNIILSSLYKLSQITTITIFSYYVSVICTL